MYCVRPRKNACFGYLLLNSYNNNHDNQSQPTYCAMKPCEKFHKDPYTLLSSNCLRTKMSSDDNADIDITLNECNNFAVV